MKIGKWAKIVFFVLGLLFVLPTAFLAVFATDLFSTNPEPQAFKNSQIVNKADVGIQVQFIRHATLILIAGGKKLLVDPMLGMPGSESPFPLTANRIRNPLIPLPSDVASIINDMDVVILTHCHSDHFDKAAQNILPKDIVIFCQPSDIALLRRSGFTNLHAIIGSEAFGSLIISRYVTNHALDSLKSQLGPNSSFNVNVDGRSIFITGDAVLDDLLISGLNAARPQIIIANAGAAQFIFGLPITLDAESIVRITEIAPDADMIAVHMNAINHCKLGKDELRTVLEAKKLSTRVSIPDEGEISKIY